MTRIRAGLQRRASVIRFVGFNVITDQRIRRRSNVVLYTPGFQSTLDPDRLVKRVKGKTGLVGHMDNLVRRRGWHVDTGAVVGHEEKLHDTLLAAHYLQ